ncbi:ribosome biogenesis GTPase RsgA, partial [Klebsiella pneumoniae]
MQEEQAARADARETRGVEELEGGDLGPEQTGQLIAHFGVQVEVESADRQGSRWHLPGSLL